MRPGRLTTAEAKTNANERLSVNVKVDSDFLIKLKYWLVKLCFMNRCVTSSYFSTIIDLNFLVM